MSFLSHLQLSHWEKHVCHLFAKAKTVFYQSKTQCDIEGIVDTSDTTSAGENFSGVGLHTGV